MEPSFGVEEPEINDIAYQQIHQKNKENIIKTGCLKKRNPGWGAIFLREFFDAITRQTITILHAVLFSLLGAVPFVHAVP